MLRSDAKVKSIDNVFNNIDSIRLDIMFEIQKDVDPYDMTSLVFLLYEVPDTALQRLIIHQRVSKDGESNNMNLLYDWALYAQSRSTWKHEFLEALCICRLHNIIRKLGFNVLNVINHHMEPPENVHFKNYVDPMKKAMYKLCESMTSESLSKLKNTLITYDIDVSEHETCEAVFLELMCRKLINLGQYNKETKTYTTKYNIEWLAKFLDNFSRLREFATTFRVLQNHLNDDNRCIETNVVGASPTKENLNDSARKHGKHTEEFDEIFQLLNQLQTEDIPIENLKSDTTQLLKDAYVIKNKNRLGVCCIINQEVFHPSKDSIEGKEKLDLEDRAGSRKDLYCLERTMSSLNFIVKSKSNLDHKDFIKFIKDVIRNDVLPEDSVFMLCILSHGIRGHVYAADSVKIKVEDIQNLLDSDYAQNLHGIPKVLIIQACQIDVDPEVNKLIVSDAPKPSHHLRKSHFLIYWATAPEYEAYRLVNKGSLFIQCLCAKIQSGKQEHLFDIFTKVTACVTSLCKRLQRAQVPIFESTLLKKLYLRYPE